MWENLYIANANNKPAEESPTQNSLYGARLAFGTDYAAFGISERRLAGNSGPVR